jgi:hypothetical protein
VCEAHSGSSVLKVLVEVTEAANKSGEATSAGTSLKEPPPQFRENAPEINWHAEIPPRLNLKEKES